MRVAVIFNGKPYCGKDYFADALFDVCDGRVFRRSIKTHIINRVANEYDLSEEEIAYYSSDSYKEQPFEKLGNMSWRQLLTHVSENKMKVELGENGIALLECAELNQVTPSQVYIDGKYAFCGSLFIYSDCGYHPEALTVLDNVDRMVIIRLTNTKDEKDVSDRRELLNIVDDKVTTLYFDNPKESTATTNILHQIMNELS